MRSPDVTGVRGVGWKLALPNVADGAPVDWGATLQSWLVNATGYHPFWSWWQISVVHLRPIPGESKPANKHYPSAEFEFMILSLNPEYPPPDPDLGHEGFKYLLPPDVVVQFDGIPDDKAGEIAMMAAALVVRGTASPDSDWRAWWKRAVEESVEHALGAHAHGHKTQRGQS